MSLRVTVSGGGGDFEIAKECVRSVRMTTDIPLNSDARTKDVGSTLILKGKILSAVDGDPFDSTRQLGLWSMVPAEDATAYRQVTVEITEGGLVERKYTFPRAFVVDYREVYGDTDGIGIFKILIKQKKDKLELVTVEGGYGA